MIQQFILKELTDIDYVLIDPSASNTKAIHVYKKASFEKIADFVPEYDPIPHVMMRLSVKDLSKKYSSTPHT